MARTTGLDPLGGILVNLFVTCFVVRYKLLSVKSIAYIQGYFFFFVAISLTERVQHIHLCPRVVLTAADFKRSRGDALLFLNKVVPYLISLHVFIFCWFYNQRCTNQLMVKLQNYQRTSKPVLNGFNLMSFGQTFRSLSIYSDGFLF